MSAWPSLSVSAQAPGSIENASALSLSSPSQSCISSQPATSFVSGPDRHRHRYLHCHHQSHPRRCPRSPLRPRGMRLSCFRHPVAIRVDGLRCISRECVGVVSDTVPVRVRVSFSSLGNASALSPTPSPSVSVSSVASALSQSELSTPSPSVSGLVLVAWECVAVVSDTVPICVGSRSSLGNASPLSPDTSRHRYCPP